MIAGPKGVGQASRLFRYGPCAGLLCPLSAWPDDVRREQALFRELACSQGSIHDPRPNHSCLPTKPKSDFPGVRGNFPTEIFKTERPTSAASDQSLFRPLEWIPCGELGHSCALVCTRPPGASAGSSHLVALPALGAGPSHVTCFVDVREQRRQQQLEASGVGTSAPRVTRAGPGQPAGAREVPAQSTVLPGWAHARGPMAVLCAVTDGYNHQRGDQATEPRLLGVGSQPQGGGGLA